MLKILTFIFCLLALTISAIAQQKPVRKVNSRPAAKPKAVIEPFADATVAAMAAQCVRFETEAGNIEMEMFPESAPETVRNFLSLSASGFYDTTTISRIVPNFVIQGGDLATRAKNTVEFSNRAQRRLRDEPNLIKHERGIVSMARATEPNSATTSFFILVTNAPTLDGTFAAFGRVIKGMEIVDSINKSPVQNEKPDKPVHLNHAVVAPCQIALITKD